MAKVPQLSRLVKKADAVAISASVLVSRSIRSIRGELSNLSRELNLAGSADDRDRAYQMVRTKMNRLSRQLNRLVVAQNQLAAKAAAEGASAMTGVQIKYSPQRAQAVFETVTPAQGENLAAVFTDRMAQGIINSLREATVSALREQAVAGGSMKETAAAMREKWYEAVKDETPRFVDSSGREWNTATYFQMNVRTNTMRVYNDCLIDDVARETGSDIMRISTGGSDPNCECAAWEGTLISITGRTKGLPTYDDAKAGGCFHPNCVHVLEYVDEDADAAEIERAQAHPFDRPEKEEDIWEAQDNRKYEIDQAVKREEGMTAEEARVAVDRDNLAASIRAGLIRADAEEVVAKMTDEQVTALCPDGNPPAFEPFKPTKKELEEGAKEKWNHGKWGGVVHISAKADAADILKVCKIGEGAKPKEPPKPAEPKPEEPKKPEEPRKTLEEVYAMKIEDALKLKQIDDLVPDAAARLDEAERKNNAERAKLKEIEDKIEALFKLPFQERVKRRAEYIELTEARAKLTREARRNAFRRNVAAFGFTENNCTVKTGRVSKVREEVFLPGKELLEKLYARDVFPDRPLVVSAVRGSEKRAFHRTGELFLTAQNDAGEVVHEASHFVEFVNPHVHERCLEFLRYRTAGEVARPLRELTGNKAYKAYEVARPDKFFDPYCGKDYGGRATEILSMGVEQLTRDPKKFYNDDPEYFRFCVGIMRGQV